MSPRQTKSAKATGSRGREPRQADVRDLFSFQLQRLAGLSTRIAALSIRPKFNVTPREWRVLAVLGYLQQAPFQELARHSGILKSQLSRTVTSLVERGFIRRATNLRDARSTLLRLSPKGLVVYDRILSASHVRNDRMLALLSAKEREVLSELVARVLQASFEHYSKMKTAGRRRNGTLSTKNHGKGVYSTNETVFPPIVAIDGPAADQE